MLVLSRRRDSTIQIGGDVEITVLEIHKGHVKLGIRAPEDVVVRRGIGLSPTGRGRSRVATAALPPAASAASRAPYAR